MSQNVKRLFKNMNAQLAKKFVSLTLALSILYGIVAAPVAEANLWESRKEAAEEARRSNSPSKEYTQMARLPGGLSGIASDASGIESVIPNLSHANTAPIATFQNKQYSAQELQTLKAAQGYLPPALMKLPYSYGEIHKIHLSDNKNAPFILLIQDAHEVESAQRNVANTLLHLQANLAKSDKSGKPQALLIGMEGTTGGYVVSQYRARKNKEAQKEVWEILIRKALINGAEYFALTAPQEPLLWGVEDENLYLDNVLAYRRGLELKDETLDVLSRLESTLNAIKIQYFTREMLNYDAVLQKYEKREASLADFLKQFAGKPEITSGRYPHVEKYMAVLKMEQDIDFMQVEAQRTKLIKLLTERLKENDLNKLLQVSLAYRLGRIGYAQYYSFFKEFVGAAGIDLSKYAQFNAYVRYVMTSEKIDTQSLINEIDALKSGATAQFAKTEDQKRAFEYAAQFRLLEKMMRQELSPDEWEKYETKRAEIAQLPIAIKIFARKAGVPEPSLRTTPKFPDLVKAYEGFYTASHARNHALVDNMVRKVSETFPNQAQPFAVMIAGGFHTPGLQKEFEEKDFSYAVFRPRIGKIVGTGTDYLNFFAPTRTPLEKLMLGDKLFMMPHSKFAERVPDAFKEQIDAARAYTDATIASVQADLGDPAQQIKDENGVQATVFERGAVTVVRVDGILQIVRKKKRGENARSLNEEELANQEDVDRSIPADHADGATRVVTTARMLPGVGQRALRLVTRAGVEVASELPEVAEAAAESLDPASGFRMMMPGTLERIRSMRGFRFMHWIGLGWLADYASGILIAPYIERHVSMQSDFASLHVNRNDDEAIWRAFGMYLIQRMTDIGGRFFTDPRGLRPTSALAMLPGAALYVANVHPTVTAIGIVISAVSWTAFLATFAMPKSLLERLGRGIFNYGTHALWNMFPGAFPGFRLSMSSSDIGARIAFERMHAAAAEGADMRVIRAMVFAAFNGSDMNNIPGAERIREPVKEAIRGLMIHNGNGYRLENYFQAGMYEYLQKIGLLPGASPERILRAVFVGDDDGDNGAPDQPAVSTFGDMRNWQRLVFNWVTSGLPQGNGSFKTPQSRQQAEDAAETLDRFLNAAPAPSGPGMASAAQQVSNLLQSVRNADGIAVMHRPRAQAAAAVRGVQDADDADRAISAGNLENDADAAQARSILVSFSGPTTYRAANQPDFAVHPLDDRTVLVRLPEGTYVVGSDGTALQLPSQLALPSAGQTPAAVQPRSVSPTSAAPSRNETRQQREVAADDLLNALQTQPVSPEALRAALFSAIPKNAVMSAWPQAVVPDSVSAAIAKIMSGALDADNPFHLAVVDLFSVFGANPTPAAPAVFGKLDRVVATRLDLTNSELSLLNALVSDYFGPGTQFENRRAQVELQHQQQDRRSPAIQVGPAVMPQAQIARQRAFNQEGAKNWLQRLLSRAPGRSPVANNEAQTEVIKEINRMNHEHPEWTGTNVEPADSQSIAEILRLLPTEDKDLVGDFSGSLDNDPYENLQTIYADYFPVGELGAEPVDRAIKNRLEGRNVDISLRAGIATRLAALTNEAPLHFFRIKALMTQPIDQFKNKAIHEFIEELRRDHPEYNDLEDIAYGSRVFLAYKLELARLVDVANARLQAQGLEPRYNLKDVIANQKFIIHVNQETGPDIIRDIATNDFFGFNPDNVVFIYQDVYNVWKLDPQTGELTLDESMDRPFGHGQLPYDEVIPGLGFTMQRNVAADGAVRYDQRFIESDALGYMESRGATTLSVEELANVNMLIHPLKLDQDVAAQVLFEQGYNYIGRAAENATGQKGGYMLEANGVEFVAEGPLIAHESYAHLSAKLNFWGNRGLIAPFRAAVQQSGEPSYSLDTRANANGEMRLALDTYWSNVTMLPGIRFRSVYFPGEKGNTFKEPKSLSNLVGAVRHQDAQLQDPGVAGRLAATGAADETRPSNVRSITQRLTLVFPLAGAAAVIALAGVKALTGAESALEPEQAQQLADQIRALPVLLMAVPAGFITLRSLLARHPGLLRIVSAISRATIERRPALRRPQSGERRDILRFDESLDLLPPTEIMSLEIAGEGKEILDSLEALKEQQTNLATILAEEKTDEDRKPHERRAHDAVLRYLDSDGADKIAGQESRARSLAKGMGKALASLRMKTREQAALDYSLATATLSAFIAQGKGGTKAARMMQRALMNNVAAIAGTLTNDRALQTVRRAAIERMVQIFRTMRNLLKFETADVLVDGTGRSNDAKFIKDQLRLIARSDKRGTIVFIGEGVNEVRRLRATVEKLAKEINDDQKEDVKLRDEVLKSIIFADVSGISGHKKDDKLQAKVIFESQNVRLQLNVSVTIATTNPFGWEIKGTKAQFAYWLGIGVILNVLPGHVEELLKMMRAVAVSA